MCAGVQTGKLEEVAGIPHGQPTRHNPRSQRVKPECSVPCAPHHLGATCSHSQFTQSVVSQQTSTEPPPPMCCRHCSRSRHSEQARRDIDSKLTPAPPATHSANAQNNHRGEGDTPN